MPMQQCVTEHLQSIGCAASDVPPLLASLFTVTSSSPLKSCGINIQRLNIRFQGTQCPVNERCPAKYNEGLSGWSEMTITPIDSN